MTARRLEACAAELAALRRESIQQVLVAAGAAGGALAASATGRPTLASALLLGAVGLAVLAVGTRLRRTELIEALATNPSAHEIPEVRSYALAFTSPARRAEMARSIRLLLAPPPPGAADPLAARVREHRRELEALADELADPRATIDPACAVACHRLLTDGRSSPLWARELGSRELRSALLRIHSGIRPS